MNCKKYRACLIGIIAVMLLCGVLIYMKTGKANQIPTDGTLVQNAVGAGNEDERWA